MPPDQQAIQQTKRNRWDDEQIHRRDAVGMIVEKCFPTLGRRPCTPNHILGHAGLPDFDTELEQLSMDPWSSPERLGDAHLADKLAFSCGTVGRPPRCLDFQHQYALKPARCQRMIVSGLTIASASHALGN